MAFEDVNNRLLLCVFAASLGPSFQSGYNIGVINSPQKIIEEWIGNLTADRQGIAADEVSKNTITIIWSAVVAIFCVGGMIGAVSTRIIAETFGRKGGLLISNVLVVIAAIFLGCAKPARSYEMLLVGRLVIGMYAGLGGGLCSMYLNEISPVSIRGAVGSVYQLGLTMSISVSQILSMEYLIGTEAAWPFLLAFTVIPAIGQLVIFPFCAESPRYLLLTKGQEEKTREALTWLRDTDDVEGEIQALHAEQEALRELEQVSLLDLFRVRMLRTPLIIASISMVSQQFSGINAVMYYSTGIFIEANLSTSSAQFATIGMGLINVLMTVVSMLVVEMAGRKVLLFAGYAGMSVISILLTICLVYVETVQWVAYLTIVLVILFVVCFATGPGTIPWFLVTEMFSQAARSAATSFAVLINWTCNFIIAIAFLPLQSVMGPYVFIIFIILLVIFAAYVYFQVPETKGRTIEEVTAMFA